MAGDLLILTRHSSYQIHIPLQPRSSLLKFYLLVTEHLGMRGGRFWKSGWVQIIDCLVDKLCFFQWIMGAINSFYWIQHKQLQWEEEIHKKPRNSLVNWWQYQA